MAELSNPFAQRYAEYEEAERRRRTADASRARMAVLAGDLARLVHAGHASMDRALSLLPESTAQRLRATMDRASCPCADCRARR